MEAIQRVAAVQILARQASVLLVAVLVLVLASCGGNNQCGPPTISSLSPNTATAGGPQFTLTVDGKDWGSDSVLRWNGSSRATTVLSGNQLTATILASDIASPGTAEVTVHNPPSPSGIAGGCPGGTSDPAPFTIGP